MVAMCLYEDLLSLRESITLIRGIEGRTLVVNAKNQRVGVSARRGDGTFGPLVSGHSAELTDGFAVARGKISTVEIGVEVKVLSKSMTKQRDRVDGDLAKQVAAFQTKANNPVCIGVVGINWSDRYTNYEKNREYRSNGHDQPHPVQEAAKAEAWLSARLNAKFDELLFLRYRASNETPFPFEWVDHIETRTLYAAALARIASTYEIRFGSVHSSM